MGGLITFFLSKRMGLIKALLFSFLVSIGLAFMTWKLSMSLFSQSVYGSSIWLLLGLHTVTIPSGFLVYALVYWTKKSGVNGFLSALFVSLLLIPLTFFGAMVFGMAGNCVQSMLVGR